MSKNKKTLSIRARIGDVITLQLLPPSDVRQTRKQELIERLATKDLLLTEIGRTVRQLKDSDLVMDLIERALEV